MLGREGSPLKSKTVGSQLCHQGKRTQQRVASSPRQVQRTQGEKEEWRERGAEGEG